MVIDARWVAARCWAQSDGETWDWLRARSFWQGEVVSLAREFAMSSPAKLWHAYSEVVSLASLARLPFSQNRG
jgi:hypothetical protein